MPSQASVSRSSTSRGQMTSLADQMLHASLTSSRNSSSMATRPSYPPSYHTKPTATRPSSTTTSGRSSASADLRKRRKSDWQQEIEMAKANLPPRGTKGVFKKACSTDVLFLIDATHSMEPYIEAAKEQVRTIVADIKEAFLHESVIRIAVVVYRDHQCAPNIEFLDFTMSLDHVHSFLDGITTDWGRDFPEDVLGGLHQALHASWQQQTRCLIHIGDAPPHGQGLHDFAASGDDYYTPGSEPHGLRHEPLLAKLIQLHINYVLLRIGAHTDRMSLVFAQMYGLQNAKLHTANKYCTEFAAGKFNTSLNSQSGSLTLMAPQLEELQLGTTLDAIRHLVVNTVTSSISRTAGRLSLALGKGKAAGGGLPFNNMTIIQEDASTAGLPSEGNSISLETNAPQWNTPGWLDETLAMDGFCPDVMTHNASTLNDMMDAPENIKLGFLELDIKARSQPFAKGSVRTASYARTAISKNPYVLKRFIRDDHGSPEMAEDMRMQALCKAFALEFNGLLQIEPPLDFVVTSCLQRKTDSGANANEKTTCYSLEAYIPGTYVKYNSNAGFVNEELANDPFNQMAQAFSHFTFERSWGHFLVDDIQGVGHLLTDPSVQTSKEDVFNLNDTNLHEDGFKFFFATHQCNSYCEELGLKSNRAMMLTKQFEFRERWPVMKPTVCCSNKLCRSILHLASAHQSDEYPNLYWCDTCWPQLQSTVVRFGCLEPGPNHFFEVSRFYHESQGQLTPQKCPEHREKDPTTLTPAATGGNLFNKRAPAGPTGFVSGKGW